MSKKNDNLEDLNDLYQMKIQLTNLLDQYIQARVDLNLKSYYSSLSVELTNKIIEEIDHSTSKVVDKITKH